MWGLNDLEGAYAGILQRVAQATLRHVYEEGEKLGAFVERKYGMEISDRKHATHIMIPIEAWAELAKEAGL